MPSENIILSLGINIAPALSQIDREISAFEKRRGLNLNINSSSFATATRNLNEFDRAIQNSQKHILAYGAGIAIIEGVRRAVEDSAKAFINLDAALVKINANANLSAAKLNELGKSIFNIARNTGQTFDEAAKAVNIFIQQGNSATEAAKKASAALTLMRQSGSDLEDSVEAITTALSAFSKEGLTATKIIDQFASVTGKFAVSGKVLEETFTGVSESAEAAGVSSKQLTAIITSLSAQTQATGPRIRSFLNVLFGNEVKPQSIEQFRALGVQIQKLNGDFLPATQIIQNLSKRYDELNKASNGANNGLKEQFVQLLGGSRNLNLINALLSDATKKNGIYAQSLLAVADAEGAAARKNDEFNKSFSAQLNSAAQTLEQVAAKVGNLTFGKLFGQTVGNLNSLTKTLSDNSNNPGEQIGKKIGEGILKGIGSAISGPGLVIGGVIFAKLLGQVGGYAKKAVGDLLKTNSAAEQQENIQKSITSILQQQPQIYKQILALGNDEIAQKKLILDLLKQQAAVQIGSTALTNTLASSVYNSGGRVNNYGKISFKADGYTPELAAAISNENIATSNNVGGGAGGRPVVVPNFSIGGLPQTIVANDKEYFVPTTSLNPSYNGPDKVSIINPDMVRSMGGLPAGAIPIHAKGFVPNAANGIPYEAFSTYLGDQGSYILQSIIPYVLGGAASVGLGGIGTGLLGGFLKGSGGGGELNFRSNFSARGGAPVDIFQLAKNKNDLAEFNATGGDSFDEPSNEFSEGDTEFGTAQDYYKSDQKNQRARELRAIKKLGLIGSNRVKSRKKSGLLQQANRLGLGELSHLNKFEIANLINLHTIASAPDLVGEGGLINRGFSFGSGSNSIDKNFRLLRRVGFHADGMIPNMAIGDILGKGFQSTVYDAGAHVFKEENFKGASQNETRRGLQFLGGLINQDSQLKRSGIQVALPSDPPNAIKSLFEGNKGFFQPNLSGFRKANSDEAAKVRSQIGAAISRRGFASRKGFTSFTLGDLREDNILIDKAGHPVVIDLLANKSESYRRILRKKNTGMDFARFANGMVPNFAKGKIPEGYTLDTQNPTKLKDYTAYITANGVRTLYPNNVPDEFSGSSKIGPVTINRNGESYTYTPPIPNDTISNTTAPIASGDDERINLYNQLKAAGVKNLRSNFTLETLKRRAAAQGGGAGGLPPNIPIAPPAPSAPTPPSNNNNRNIQPINLGDNNIPQFMLDEAKRFGLAIRPDETVKSLQKGFRQLKENHFDVSDEVINYKAPTTNQSRAAAVRGSANFGNLNLLNKNASDTLPLITSKGNISPSILNQVKDQLTAANKKFGSPLNSAQIGDLAKEVITDNLLTLSKEAQKQIGAVVNDKSSLKQKIDQLTTQTQGNQLGTQINNAITKGENLSPALKRAFLSQTKKKLLSQFDPQSRSNPQVQDLVNQLAKSELGITTGQIKEVQNDKNLNKNSAEFTNTFIDRYGGLRGSFLRENSQNSKIENFIKKQVDLGADESEVRNQITNLKGTARERSNQNRNQKGLGLAFTAPLLSNLATSGLDDNSPYKSNINGVTNSLSTGGTVLAVGGFNPLSIGIAATVTSIGLLKTALDNFGPSVKATGDAYQKALDKENNNQKGIDSYIDSIGKIQDLKDSGASKSVIKSAISDQAAIFSNLDPDIQKQVLGKNTTQLSDFSDQNKLDAVKRTSSSALDSVFSQIDAKGGNFFTGRSNTKLLQKYGLAGSEQSDFEKEFLKQYIPGYTGNGTFNNSFGGDDGKNLLNQAVKSLSDKGVTSSDINSTGSNGLKSKIGDADFEVFTNLNNQEKFEIKRALIAREKNIKAQDENTASLQDETASNLRLNQDIKRSISQGIFQQGFAAQGNFNTQSNRIAAFTGSLEVGADEYTPSVLQAGKFSAARASIQNETSLATNKALGSGLTELLASFQDKPFDKNTPNSLKLGQQTLEGIKDGSLFGDDAINALKKIGDSLGVNDPINQKIQDILEKNSEQLADIGQKAQSQLALLDIQNKLAQREIEIQTQRNFAGGLGTFTNPSSFSSISGPIQGGISSLISQGTFNNNLNTQARRFQTLTPQGAIGTAQSIQATNAGFGRANLGLNRALTSLAGGDSSIVDKINSLTGGADVNAGFVTDQRKLQFSGLANDALSNLGGLKGDFGSSIYRIQRETSRGINNLDLSKALQDLQGLRANSGNPANQNSLDKVIGLFSILSDEVKKVAGSSKEQLVSDYKKNSLSPEDKAQQDLIEAEKDNTTRLISSTTDLITSQNQLDDTLKQIYGIQNPSSKSSSTSYSTPGVNNNYPLAPKFVGPLNNTPLLNDRNQLKSELTNVTSLQGISISSSQIDSFKKQRNNLIDQAKKDSGGVLNQDMRDLFNKLDGLIDSLKAKDKVGNPDNPPIGVDANVKVAVNVAGNIQSAKNLDGLGDIIKQYILANVKDSAINKAAPPNIAAVA